MTKPCHALCGQGLLGPMSQRREDVFGQRRADLSDRLSSLLLLTLAGELIVDSSFRLPLCLLGGGEQWNREPV